MKLIRYIFLLCCVACFMSCSSDDSPSDTAKVRVVFRLYAPTTTTESRADGDPTDEGEDWESAINVNRLHVVLYAKDGTSIGGLENVTLVSTSDPNIYDVTGSILVDKLSLSSNGQFDGRIMVYANMDDVKEASSFNGDLVNSLTFTANTGKHTIPMWGFKQLNVSLKAGSQTNIGTINLLRAEAKIRVFLRSDMVENYELTNVKLSQANKQGYCLPQYQNIHNISDVQELDHDAFAHFWSKGSNQTNQEKLTDVDMTNKAIYVPEYENKVSSTDRASQTDAAVIKLTLKDKRDSKTQDYTLPFVEYDANGAPTQTAKDIVRDHYYKFEVYKNDDGMLRVRLKVRQWYVVKHEEIQM